MTDDTSRKLEEAAPTGDVVDAAGTGNGDKLGSSHELSEQVGETRPPAVPRSSRRRPSGFALLSPEERKAVASKGGKAAQTLGRGHRWDASEAKSAGRKGGKTIGKDRQHMSTLGKAGAAARIRNKQERGQ